MTPKFKRGEVHPTNRNLVFFRYQRGKEVWVTPQKLKLKRQQCMARHVTWSKTDKGKQCKKESDRKQNQRPSVKKYRSDYYKQEHVRERYREKYANDPELRKKIADYSKTPKARESQRKSTAKRKDKIKDYNAKYDHAGWRKRKIESDPSYLAKEAARLREYRKNNPDKARKWERNNRKTNINLALSVKLRNRVSAVLRGRAGAKKTLSTETLIGCSFSAFRVHFESQFTEGMTWDAVMSGKIHVEHHIPCAAFDLTKVDQQLICFNFQNLKPMWAKPNLQKSDKMIVDGKEVRGRDLRKQNIIPFLQEQKIA